MFVLGRISGLDFRLVVAVFQLKLSPSQLLSHQFASELAGIKSLGFSVTEDNHLLTSEAVLQGQELVQSLEKITVTGTLVLFAEGLNLEKISLVSAGVAELMQLGEFSFVQQDTPTNMLAVKAQVNLLNESELPSTIEAIALALQVEIAYLTAAPTLAEPGLLLMDMDSTVINVECIDEIAKLAGVGEQVSAVTELAMQGKLDFAQSLESRVACLTDTPEAVLQTVRNALPLMPGIATLVDTLKAQGWKVAIASGGFTFFADYLKERLGLDEAVANNLEIIQGKLTGKVTGGIVDAKVKAETLVALAEKWNIPKSQTIALGDGANDLVMMSEAGLGVAYHAKPIVRQKADAGIRFSSADSLLLLLS